MWNKLQIPFVVTLDIIGLMIGSGTAGFVSCVLLVEGISSCDDDEVIGASTIGGDCCWKSFGTY